MPIDALLDALASWPMAVLLGVVWLGMALESSLLVGMVMPGDLLVLAAATTVRSPAAFLLLVGAVTLGSLTGEALGYGIGHRWGPRLRYGPVGRRLGEERWARTAGYLRRRGGRAVAAARFLAFAHALTPVLAGTARMPFRRFVAASAVGGAVWATAMVGLGTALSTSYRELSRRIGTVSWVAVAALVLAGAVVVLVQRRRRPAPAGAGTGRVDR